MTNIVLASTKVFGIGWALFLALLLAAALILLHLLTQRHPKHQLIQAIALSLYIILILSIALFPKINVGDSYSTRPDVVDGDWYWKIVFVIMMTAGAGVSTVGAVYYVFWPVYAQPIQD